MSYYIKSLYNFLDSLSANNNREWFEQHRSEYETLRALWLEDIDRLISNMSQWDPDLASQTARSSAYRIYRDTRFSKDKTPYKTFFSASIARGGRKSPYAGFYIEIGNAQFYDQGLYGGLWCPSAELLRKMRHAIVDNIEEWEEIVNEPRLIDQFPGWCVNRLKTIPKGWDRNHPQREYLRMTNYGKFHPCTRQFYLDPAWPERSAELFHILDPLIRFLNYTIDE
ncbi:MAG: DUF2461 domain-containing protein [Barnesiella sp.]|nr:DUF2461 domain-containing protein [Barnesiella sp.]